MRFLYIFSNAIVPELMKIYPDGRFDLIMNGQFRHASLHQALKKIIPKNATIIPFSLQAASNFSIKAQKPKKIKQ